MFIDLLLQIIPTNPIDPFFPIFDLKTKVSQRMISVLRHSASFTDEMNDKPSAKETISKRIQFKALGKESIIFFQNEYNQWME